MSSVDLRKVGSISLLDLDIIGRFYGRDFLPYPFMFTQPSRFQWHHEYLDYARSVPDRFRHGDLAEFQPAFARYAHADIRVECHVQYIPADTPNVRVAAARRGQLGTLAKQRPGEDVIDVYELSAYALGPATADCAALQAAGRRSAIIVPEYAPGVDNPVAADNFTIQHALDNVPSATAIAPGKVSAFGVVQSHWRPPRHWGPDIDKNAAVWIRIDDDGDYLYTADFSEARPVGTPALAERIDRLIAEDVKALRRIRAD